MARVSLLVFNLVFFFLVVSVNSQYINNNLPPNYYYKSIATDRNNENVDSTFTLNGTPTFISPAEETLLNLTNNVGTKDRHYVLKNTVGVIAQPVGKVLTGTAKVVKKTVGGAFQIVGNTLQSLGGIVTSGNPVKGTVKAVGNIVGGVVKPVEGIVGSSLELVTGTVSEVLNKVGDQFKAIYPGTRWCGDGDRASDIEDLGLFYKTDACCRSHDLCNVNIKAGETKYGLYNNGQFTRSHCQCDTDFYNCLKNTGSLVATKIGITYFNLLSPQCFKVEYPATCVKYGRTLLLQQKCVQYAVNNYLPPVWQWFDNQSF